MNKYYEERLRMRADDDCMPASFIQADVEMAKWAVEEIDRLRRELLDETRGKA